MSILFTPKKLGPVEIQNRFIHSATCECMASENGHVTDELIRRYRKIAKGGVGLIIPGYLYITPNGRAVKYQTGIHNDDMIGGLKKLVDVVHDEGSKIAFQVVHSGRQTTVRKTPLAPSRGSRDAVYMVKPKEMTEEEIWEVIKAFGAAASRASEAGSDGIQINAAHGYLVNQFLSPFFNKRVDSWGGSDENRFRFLKEVVLETRRNISDEKPVMVKLNTQDYTPKEGITLGLAKKYAEWLADLPIDGLEVSCGTLSYSMFNMIRGDVPTKEIIMNFPWWRKIVGKMVLKKMEGKFELEEGYNLEAAKLIKPVMGDIALFAVGGMRSADHMEKTLKDGAVDFISMCRPFIREPNIVNKIREGKTAAVACVSCNRCFAAIANEMPVKCYQKGFPKKLR